MTHKPKKIAVGTLNPAKIEAVQMVIDRIWPNSKLMPVAVPSSVSIMPMSDEECLTGARARALSAIDLTDAELGIGMEAGVNQELEGLMLLGWVAIAGENGREGIASTARLPLPAAIAARVLEGEELGPVMDQILNQNNVKQKGGAVGALTGGLVLRKETFAIAVAYALAPFVSPRFYDFPSQ
jgi:inosine/xanthosine triphosphatase